MLIKILKWDILLPALIRALNWYLCLMGSVEINRRHHEFMYINANTTSAVRTEGLFVEVVFQAIPAKELAAF